MGCRLWGCAESDTTEATQQQQQLLITYKKERLHFVAEANPMQG